MNEQVIKSGSLAGAAASALASAAASICCIGPVAISILGVQGAILAAGIKPYRVYLLGASLVMLGLAFWSVYFPRSASGACAVRAGRASRFIVWTAIFLWVAALVVQFVADRLWL